MSRDSQGPRKTFSKGGSSDFNKRKSFSSSEKPKRTYKSAGSEGSSFKKRDGDSTEKRTYTKRDDSEKRPRKSFDDKDKTSFSGEKRAYGKRQDGSFKSKSSGSFGDKEKRPYTKREDSDRPRKSFGDDDRKPFVKRADGKYESAGPRKSFDGGEKRSYTKREDSDRPRKSFGDDDKKPFVKRADGKYESSGPRKSFDGGEKRSYTKREDSDRPRKSFGDDDKKPFVKRADGKYESSGPRKSFDGAEKRSYTKREDSDSKPRRSFEDGEKRSYTKREDGDRKPYVKRDDDKKPYEPKLSKTERVVEKSKKAGPKKTSTQQNVSDDAIRLNRYVANSGVCSRREADVLIATGVVTVNGKIVTEMGYKVNPGDVVNYGGVPIKNETKKYLLLNKPKDYITTMDDPEERRTVMELIRKACKERLYPVGRLDRNTTGILLFTNDGDMTAKLTHPKFDVRKVYHVTLDKKITSEDYRILNEGIELADGFIKPDAVEHVGAGKFELGVEIHSGRNRIVRRMFEHLGYEVVKLDRVAFAGLTKKDLPRGKFRFLTEKEISFLKMLG
ncbi:MAG: pseudouridine synthase [Bacteroidota bacterium]